MAIIVCIASMAPSGTNASRTVTGAVLLKPLCLRRENV